MKNFENKKITMSFNMKMFLVFVFVCAAMLAFFSPAYSVYLGGKQIAVVHSGETFEKIFEKANARIAEVAGENAVITEQPQYLFKIVPKNSYTPEEDITERLMEIPGNIVKSCEIIADGKTVAYAESESAAKKILKKVKDSYGGYDKEVITKLEYKKTYILNFNLYNSDGVYNALKNSVAVKSKEKSESETETPFEVVKQENPELKKGQTNVLQEGTPGKDIVKTVYTLINGIRESGNIVSRTVLSASVPEILEVGTKEVTGMGSGTLIKPVSGGTVTSRFGARDGRRTAHKGVDIACAGGTPVAAADEGVCITAEYRNDYGNLIIIDHQNGYKTYYAHLSSIGVAVGDVIEKGQIIGETGSTGISTGPHIHFEVRKDDEPCNPSEFVSLTE